MGLPGEFPENHCKQHHKGHKAQQDQRQCVVDSQHGDQHTAQHHHIFYQGHQDVCEHHGNGIGIVGDTGDQLAHGDVVQLLVGQAFNVGKDIHTQLGENFLTDFLQQDRLQIGANQTDQQNAGVDAHQCKQVRQVELCLHKLLNVTHQQRGENIVANGKEHNDEHGNEILPEGKRIPGKPFHNGLVRQGPFKLLVCLFLHSKVGDEEQ